MKKLTLILSFALFFLAATVQAGNVNIIQYALNAGSTVTYQTAFTSIPVTINSIYACDASGQVVKVAQGPAGFESDLFVIPTSSCALFTVNPYLPAGTRLSIKATGVTAGPTTGTNSLSILP